MIKFIFFISFFISFSVIYAQDTTSIQKHQHELNYYCSACDHHLFNENDVVKEEGELHYHVPPSDFNQTAISCASCNAKIGFFNKKESNYQIGANHIQKNETTSEYHCITCSSPLFDKGQLLKSDRQHIYFSEPIEEDLINLNSSNFYKIEDSNALCNNCGHHLGKFSGTEVEGFGVRIKLGSVFKK